MVAATNHKLKWSHFVRSVEEKRWPIFQLYQHQHARDQRFEDEDDYENEIFPILSSAHVRTNVILAGKFGSRRQATTSFSQQESRSGKKKLSNVRNFIIQRSGEGFASFNGNKRTNFVVKKSTMKLCRVSILREQARKLLVVVLVLESNALKCMT